MQRPLQLYVLLELNVLVHSKHSSMLLCLICTDAQSFCGISGCKSLYMMCLRSGTFSMSVCATEDSGLSLQQTQQ